MVKTLFSNLFNSNKQKSTLNTAENTQTKLAEMRNEVDVVAFLQEHNELDADSLNNALEKIEQLESWQQLAQHRQSEIRLWAQEKIMQSLNLPEDIRQVSAVESLILVACYSPNYELAQKAMLQIKDEQTYFDLASQQHDPKVRLLAAKQLHNIDNLQQLYKQFLNKDKPLQQYCKQALAQMKQQQQAQVEEQAQISHSLMQMQRWIKIGYEPELKGKLQVCVQNWSNFSVQTDTQKEQFKALYNELAEILQQQQQSMQQQAQRQAEETQQQQLEQQLEQTLADLSVRLNLQLSAEDEQLYEQSKQQIEALSNHQNNVLTKQLKEINGRVQSHKHIHKQQANIDAVLQFENPDNWSELHRALKRINQIQNKINWQDSINMPSVLQQLKQKQLRLHTQVQHLNQQQAALIQHYQKQLQQLSELVEQGNSKAALKVYKKLQREELQINPQKLVDFKAQVHSLKVQVQDMQNWQKFAIEPKKQALIQQMQGLLDNPVGAEIQAEKIKDLQQQWKMLGDNSGERHLWEQFHQLSEQAFAPCKEHYLQQAQVRADNLKKRQMLCQQLKEYEAQMDWSQADWKLVQKTLTQAQQAFKQYSPIERDDLKQSMAEFKQVQNAVYAHLRQEYDKNIAQKQQLIDAAKELVTQQDKVQAGEQAKILQQQWQQIGICPYGPDKTLWKQFRRECDMIFANIKQQEQAQKERSKQQIQALNTELEQVRENLYVPVDQAQNQALDALKEAILNADIAAFSSKKLLKKHQDILHLQKEMQQTYKQQQKQQAWQNLQSLISALDNQQAVDLQADLPQGFNAQQLQQAQAQANEDDAYAQQLCIELEILLNIETPKAEQSLRMQLQVERLAKGMGQKQNQLKEQQELIHNWLTIRKNNALAQRFYNILKQSINVE